MDFERLPSFLLSLCLHLGVAALIIWWPGASPVPVIPKASVVDVYFTLGAPGKSVPKARQAIPEAARGRQEQAQQTPKAQEPVQPKSVAQVENPIHVPPPPELKAVQKPAETLPEKSEAIPIPKEPEKAKEQEKEKAPAKEPVKPKDTEQPKPAEKTPVKEKDSQKVDIDKELRDLAKRTGTPTGVRSGSGTARGKDKERSGGSIDKDLADLAKALGGSGDGESGSGPGGSGGDGLGMLGDYLQVVQSRVKANWSFPAQANRRQYSTLVNVQIAPDGTITQVRRLRSSGNPFYDASIENALARTAKLEPPPRPDLTNIDIEFAF